MEKIKLWNKNFIIVIVINFLVFLNHLMVLSTFPFFVRELGYSDSVSGACATPFSFGLLSAKYLIAESVSLFCLWDCAEWL